MRRTDYHRPFVQVYLSGHCGVLRRTHTVIFLKHLKGKQTVGLNESHIALGVHKLQTKQKRDEDIVFVTSKCITQRQVVSNGRFCGSVDTYGDSEFFIKFVEKCHQIGMRIHINNDK